METDNITFPCIKPNWSAPPGIYAYTTTRSGGFSHGPYESLNLGKGTADDPLAVSANRAKLRGGLRLPADPIWLQQTHGTQAVCVDQVSAGVVADAAYTNKSNTVCAVLTADCLPLLVIDNQGRKMAAIHAGWRGLAAGIIEATITQLQAPSNKLLVWLGPAISADHFEVGEEVHAAFIKKNPHAKEAFAAVAKGKWLADLYLLARQTLTQLGVTQIFGGDFCTYRNRELFFSHRRDQGVTGRMATLIWKVDLTQ